MEEERKKPTRKKIQAFLTGEEDLPTYYVNMVNVRTSLEDFFLTFGTVVPTHYVEDPEELDNLKVRPLFRCAMSRSVAQDLIKILTNCYEHQTTLIEEMQDAPTIQDGPARRD
jgi:aromatic ring-opening dioxygenase LigB subunit